MRCRSRPLHRRGRLPSTRKEKLDAICRIFPEIENKPDNLGMGDLVAHIITTPYIEIAADGMTAKGVWYSPGLCSSVGPDGHLNAMQIWEHTFSYCDN